MMIEKMNGFNLRNWLNLNLQLKIGDYKFTKSCGEITASITNEEKSIATIGIMFKPESVKRYFGYQIINEFSFVEDEVIHLCESLLNHINGKTISKKINGMSHYRWQKLPLGYSRAGITKISEKKAVGRYGDMITVNVDHIIASNDHIIQQMLKFLRW